LKHPVLVIGRVPRIVITIVRSLHNYGIPVDVANWSGRRLYSRVIREFVCLPDPQVSPAAFVARIRSLIVQRGHDMLIPADDETLAALVEHYDDLKDSANLMCPPPHITRRVLNKFSTLEVAQECGIAVPKTILVSSSAQLPELAQSFPFPWVLKPAAKEQRVAEMKIHRLTTAGEITKRFPTFRDFAPQMLLQECCPGAGVGVEVLLHRGECHAVFQHRRIKEFPHDGGVSVTAVAESPDPALVQSSLSLLRALQWEGVAMVEYKVNPADGKAVLMEVNGRYWGSLSLSVRSGLDFPLYQWKLAHDEPLAVPSAYRVGTRWRWTGGFFKRLHGLVRAARRSRPARETLLSDLRYFSRDFGPSTHDSLLSMADPLPAFVEALTTTKELLLYLWDDVRSFLRHRILRGGSG